MEKTRYILYYNIRNVVNSRPFVVPLNARTLAFQSRKVAYGNDLRCDNILQDVDYSRLVYA